MGLILFGRTQVAIETPFLPNRNPGFGGLPSGLSSDNVQDAIEEAKSDALNNDRYPIACSYGGNANTGRYLEIFPSIDSSLAGAPFVAPETSMIVAYTAGNAVLSTGVIQLRNLTTNVTLLSIVFTNQKSIFQTGLMVGGINPGDDIGVLVSSGSFNKPYVRFWVNTIT